MQESILVGPERITNLIFREKDHMAKKNLKRFDLKRLFPISHLHVFKEVFPWLLGLGIIRLALFFSGTDRLFEGDLAVMDSGGLIITGLLLGIIIIRACSVILRDSLISYALINEDRLEITKGIVLRKRGSYPLSSITEVYVSQTWPELVFGLAKVDVATPAMRSGHVASIEGLERKTAEGLQRMLIDAAELKKMQRTSRDLARAPVLKPLPDAA